ncbi:MAG: DUF4150 domain-containing protein [Planctomycetota bacterium]
MPVTVAVNAPMTVVHKSSNGMVIVFPDVCKTPSPAGPVPIPYPNIAQSADVTDTATTVLADGQKIAIKTSVFSKSSGDEPGTAGGVVSSVNRGKAKFVNYSFDVKAEGQNVPRKLDPMIQNGGGSYNTPPSPLL